MRSKIIAKNPNYNRTAKIARKFMISQSIDKLPVNPFEIACENNWKIEKTSVVAKDINVSVYHLLNHMIKTKDGVAIFCPATDEYSILYNDKIKSRGRIRWTMTHEIGHIILKHHNYKRTIISRGDLDKNGYDVLEKEADFFASLILAPPIVLHNLNVKSPKKIQNICHLSKEASVNRFNYYMRWKNFIQIPEEQIIKENFHSFIYQQKCNNCGHSFISENATYCPICGEMIEWGNGKMKYREFVELAENGRALICPLCENEDISEEDVYCKICGATLYQECTHKCDVNLDSNARYCTQCGGRTTFFEANYLDDWKKEKKEILSGDETNEIAKEVASTKLDIDDDFDVPF